MTGGQMVATAVIVLVVVAWFCVWAVTPRTERDDSAEDGDQ